MNPNLLTKEETQLAKDVFDFTIKERTNSMMFASQIMSIEELEATQKQIDRLKSISEKFKLD